MLRPSSFGCFSTVAPGRASAKRLVNLETEIRVRHFTAAETNGNLHLVAFRQELRRLSDLRVEVVRVDVQRQAHLFDLKGLLIFLGPPFSRFCCSKRYLP